MYIDSDMVRLKHIIDAAREAVDFAQDQSRQALDADRKLSLAIIHLLEIVGEAAGGISQEFQEKHNSVGWHKMIGMRNRLIHGYFDVNLDIVWNTVVEDLPELIKQLESISA